MKKSTVLKILYSKVCSNTEFESIWKWDNMDRKNSEFSHFLQNDPYLRSFCQIPGFNFTMMKNFLVLFFKQFPMGSSIQYVHQIFRKTNISYQGVRNVSFSEIFAYLLNGWSDVDFYFTLNSIWQCAMKFEYGILNKEFQQQQQQQNGWSIQFLEKML